MDAKKLEVLKEYLEKISGKKVALVEHVKKTGWAPPYFHNQESPIANYICTLCVFAAKKRLHRKFKYEPICKTQFGKEFLAKLDAANPDVIDDLQYITPWDIDRKLDEEIEDFPQSETKGSPRQLIGKSWTEDLEAIIEALRN